MIILTGRMAVDGSRHGAVAENLCSDLQACDRERELGMVWAFETSRPTLIDAPPPTRLYLLILSKHLYQLEVKLSIS